MPITMVSQRARIPILGTIRLGERKITPKGAQYPSNLEYFNLKDAPGVAEIYGEDPKELEVMFMTDDLDMAIPTWLKWYSAGTTDGNGKALGGQLNCMGPGPDENGNPGTAQYFMARDPKTMVVPTRPCLGMSCPDWKDAKGRPKCKQMMQVVCMLPRVSVLGCYVITTSSWRSIQAFHNQLTHLRDLNKGALKGIPWRIFRVEEAVPHTEADGSRSTRNHHIMKIDVLTNFKELHGQEFAKKIEQVTHLSLAPASIDQSLLLSGGHEDFYPAAEGDDLKRLQIERGETETVDVTQKKADLQTLLTDPEIDALFDAYAEALGKDISAKARGVLIRQKEAEKDPKAAVIETLKKRIAEANEKKAAQTPEPPREPEVVDQKAEEPSEPAAPAPKAKKKSTALENVGPAEDDGGIM